MSVYQSCKKTLKRVFPFIPFVRKVLFEVLRKVKLKYELKQALKLSIINDNEVGEVIETIKDDTIEECKLMNVFNHISGGYIAYNSSAIELKKYSNAIIFPSSDFIALNDNIVWHKLNYPQFTKIVPQDRDLLLQKEKTLFVRKPSKILNVNNAFSMCGVHAKVWSHFLIQFLPKLDNVDKVLRKIDGDLNIIIPTCKDPHIRRILDAFLAENNRLKLVELDASQAIKCNHLFYIENTTRYSDHSTYINPSDSLVPQFVLSFLKNKLLGNENLFPSLKNKRQAPFRKLYIKRSYSMLSPLGGSRVLVNSTEVESFFESEGFELISPHEYSLDDKRKLFSEASIIAGPYSSGFMNVIFCQPNTKILVFMNFQRIYELYLSSLADVFDLSLLAITGTDLEPNNIHSSYSVPLEKITSCYNQFKQSNEG